MGFRFRKSIKLAPGLRMNFSKSGASWTLGPRGASIGIGHRGTYLNTGIPGTGIYCREKAGGSSVRQSYASTPTRDMQIRVAINDEGILSFTDAQGNQLSEANIEAAKKQQGNKIKGLIQQKCDELNDQIEALGKIHYYTPPPLAPRMIEEKFNLPRPVLLPLKSPGFFCRLFKNCVAKVDAENTATMEQHSAQLSQWEKQKADFETLQRARMELLSRVIAGDEKTMEQHIEATLQDIVWPRETLVNFEINPGGAIAFDVDLPEIEGMPTKTATVPQRGLKLSVKEMGVTQVQKLYMRHIHAVGFRIVGETFAALPTIQTVIISAYSQRPNKATAQVENVYLYSARVSRNVWSKIQFDNLPQIDVVEAFGTFELHREMTKTGVFKPVEPFKI